MQTLLLVLLSVLATSVIAQPAPALPERDADILIDADRLAALLELPNVVVLHVDRQREEYEEAHIPAARFLPLSAVAVDREDQVNVLPEPEALRASLEDVGISDGYRVIVYGGMNGLAAARAFFALDVHGIDVGVLDGGLEAWRSAGHPVTADGPPLAERGSITLDFDASRVIDASGVFAAMQRDDAVLLDARPPEQHSGEEPGANIPRPGHIPGSENLFWEDDVQEDGTMRPVDELRTRYDAAGVTADVDVITYCRTGVQASHAYLVARILGLRPIVYDGSFHDWSNNTDYEVATGS